MVICYDEWENIVCMSVRFISVKYIPLCEVSNFLKFIVDVSYIIPSSPTVLTMFHHHNKSCPSPVMNQCVIQACITLPVADPDWVTRFLEPGQDFQI